MGRGTGAWHWRRLMMGGRCPEVGFPSVRTAPTPKTCLQKEVAMATGVRGPGGIPAWRIPIPESWPNWAGVKVSKRVLGVAMEAPGPQKLMWGISTKGCVGITGAV